MNATAWFLIIVAAVIVAFVAYGMARRARGSIDVTLPTSDFEPGETVRGEIRIHAKKPIEAERLEVTVTATEITERTEKGETERTSEQAYRGEQVVHEARSYVPGAHETFEFAIELPDRPPPPEPEEVGAKPSFTRLRRSAAPTTRLEWRLGVRLVAKGIDLATSRALTVNLEEL